MSNALISRILNNSVFIHTYKKNSLAVSTTGLNKFVNNGKARTLSISIIAHKNLKEPCN